MISIRDYKYKKIKNKIYLGIELQADGETYYKNSVIIIDFIKDNKTVKTDESLIIPMITGEGIFYIGKEFEEKIDFDEIKLTFKQGEKEYERTHDESIEWQLETFDKETRKIAYKFKNEDNDTLSYATLNLVFFNKGEIVGGTSITKENLLNKREYYFEYEIPKEIEFTEIYPYFSLPSTNELLFKGFFLEYVDIKKTIKLLKNIIGHKEDYVFVDQTKEHENNLKNAEKELKKLQKQKTRSFGRVLGTNTLKFLSGFFRCIPSLFLGIFDFLTDHWVLWLIYLGYMGLLFLTFMGFIISIFSNHDTLEYLMLFLVTLSPSLIIYLICYIPYSIYYSFKYTDYVHSKDFLTKEEKNKKIEEQQEKVKYLKEEKDKYIKNIDKYKNEIVIKNEQIKKENSRIDKENDKNERLQDDYYQKLADLLNNNPNYRIIENYEDIDFEIVSHAISNGGYSFEQIEEYRLNERKRLEDYQRELEQQMMQIEAAKREEEYRKSLLRKLEENKAEMKELRYAQQQQAEAARQAMSYASSQAYALESMNRKLSHMKDQQSINSAYAQSVYNRYF